MTNAEKLFEVEKVIKVDLALQGLQLAYNGHCPNYDILCNESSNRYFRSQAKPNKVFIPCNHCIEDYKREGYKEL
jgi:hypothetical protein